MLDKKRVLVVSVFIILIACIIFGVWIFVQNKDEEGVITEYTPQEEITDAQMRQTMVTLYFKNDDGIMPELRTIDVKELLDNPYEKVLAMLIEGPKSESLQKTIPEGTKVNKIERTGDTLIIDFTEEFILNHIGGETEEKLTIQSIVKTLTELTEINGVEIKINGEENKGFQDGFVKFDVVFTRETI